MDSVLKRQNSFMTRSVIFTSVFICICSTDQHVDAAASSPIQETLAGIINLVSGSFLYPLPGGRRARFHFFFISSREWEDEKYKNERMKKRSVAMEGWEDRRIGNWVDGRTW